MKNIAVILILILLASVCFCASQITCNSDTGLTAYSILYRDKSAGGLEVYHPTDEEWVASTAITFADMNIPMIEDVNLLGAYYATFPDTNVPAGRYYVRTYSRLGASPTKTDTVIGYDIYSFDGTAEIMQGNVVQLNGSSTALEALTSIAQGWLDGGDLYKIIISVEKNTSLCR